MDCSTELHNGLKELGEGHCHFCNKQIEQYDSTTPDACCTNPEVISDGGNYVCKKCGQVDGAVYTTEYINFYENMYKIHKKSVYHRKYHIDNVITDICMKNNIKIIRQTIHKICQIFDEICLILPQIHA